MAFAYVQAACAGELRSLRLLDGSRVTLDAASKLRVEFTPGLRQLRLDAGRARFDVAHQAARPFIVSTPAGSVIARGMLFDVAVDGFGMKVTLLRGAVEVRTSPGFGR